MNLKSHYLVRSDVTFLGHRTPTDLPKDKGILLTVMTGPASPTRLSVTQPGWEPGDAAPEMGGRAGPFGWPQVRNVPRTSHSKGRGAAAARSLAAKLKTHPPPGPSQVLFPYIGLTKTESQLWPESHSWQTSADPRLNTHCCSPCL